MARCIVPRRTVHLSVFALERPDPPISYSMTPEELASGLGIDTAAGSDLKHDNPSKSPAEQFKEKAIEEERKEVADGSNGDTHNSGTATNGISTNPQEAHSTDSKDKMPAENTSANDTANGADDNASMLPLGKGDYSAPAMGNTPGNATPAAGVETSSLNKDPDNRTEDQATSTSHGFSSSTAPVTRAEIDSAKQAIILAVTNCKLTREVVFSDTEVGTEDGSDEVKRVLSGYRGIDEALAEMNRYIPVHVRNSQDLGVHEGERIQKEQFEAAKALQPTGFESRSASNVGIDDANGANANNTTDSAGITTTRTTADNDSAGIIPGLPASLSEEKATETLGSAPGDAGAASVALPTSSAEDEHKFKPDTTSNANRSMDMQGRDEGSDGAAILASASIASLHQGKEASNADNVAEVKEDSGAALITSANSKDSNDNESAIQASTSTSAIDKGKGRAELEGNDAGETAISTPPKSPVQGEKLSERLKREVEERARRGQLGVFNKPLGSNASQANLASLAASKEADTTATSSKDAAPASSAFTEEFGPGETGLSAPSSPAAAGVGAASASTKPPSTRARAASVSSQTSTGEKRGLLGLFRRRSKRQSTSDGSTGAGARRASQDLGRTASKDTVSSPITASAVPPAPEKPVETVDTTAPSNTEDKHSSKTSGLAALGAGAATGSLAGASASEHESRNNETAAVDETATTAEPSTSDHKIEDVAGVTEKSTQTLHEPAPALGTGAEPVVYVEETAPVDGDIKDDTPAQTSANKEFTGEDTTTLPKTEASGDMLESPAVAPFAARTEDKEEPLHIGQETSGDVVGSGAHGGAIGDDKVTTGVAETDASHSLQNDTTEETVPATTGLAAGVSSADVKGASTTAEKATSTEDDVPVIAPAVIAAPAVAAAPAHPTTVDEDTPLYSKDRTTSPGLERKSSKGGFFGLFRRRSSRRSSSGPPQRSVSDTTKAAPVAGTALPATSNRAESPVKDERAVTEEGKEVETSLANESAVVDEPLEQEETARMEAVDPEVPSSDAAKSEPVESQSDKENAGEAEAYSEATIHAYGSLNVDELETVEEELERGPEETVAEPGSFVDHEEDEERETIQSDDDHHNGVVATTGEAVPHEEEQTHETTDQVIPTSPTGHGETSDGVVSPVVAATPAERLMQSSTERRKSRGSGFFGLFRSRTGKEQHSPAQQKDYSTIVQNMGVAPKSKSEPQDTSTAVGTGDLERSKSNATARDSFLAHDTTRHHGHGNENEAAHTVETEEQREEYIEPEEEIPDNRSVTQIAASTPLPAPVYTDKTRAKHERIRKKREHEEAVERERIRRETELLNKRERILNAYTGKQDFTKVPKPARTKNFGRAHERKDLDGVQFINKSDKKAAKKEDGLVKTHSRGSSIDEPSSPSQHPASGGFAGSFPAEQSTSRVSHNTHGTTGHDVQPSSPSSPVMVSPVVKLARRVSAVAHKREKSGESAPA